MRNELKHIEEIENYLLGKFSKEEKSAFESKLQTDSSLRSEIELQKNITERIALAGFITDVKTYHTEYISTVNAASGTGNWKWIFNTFLALFVTGISALGVYYFTNSSNEKEAESNATTLTDTLSQKKKTIVKTNSVAFIPNYPDVKTPASKNSTAAFFGNSKPKANPNVIEPSYVEPTKDVLDRLQVPFEEITMDAQEGLTFNTKVSGTRILFPAGILQHEDGSKVEGEVTIRYREFRNPADMAFSNIPMEHEQNGEKFQFNSNGMIEIRAVQNGEELKIGKNTFFTIDMEVTDNLDDSYFWSMNDETKKWKCLDTLQYGNPNPEVNEPEEEYEFGMLTGKIYDALTGEKIMYAKFELTGVGDFGSNSQTFYNDTGYIIPKVKPGKYLATITCENYQSYNFEQIVIAKGQYDVLNIYLKPKKKYHHLGLNVLMDLFKKETHNKNLKNVKAHSDYTQFKDIPEYLIGNYEMIKETDAMIREKYKLNSGRKNSEINLLLEANTDVIPEFKITKPESKTEAKQEFNNTVYGLQCAGFGVYNCDQITRMKNPVTVRPMFGSTPDLPDNSIYKQMVVIDKNMNSVFSFYGTDFSCSTEGKNTLLIYYQGKIFGINEKDFSKMKINASGKYDFKMTDITEQLQSVADLKKYLEL